MDYLRQGINLRAYAQKNPKQEYKREAFEMFSALLERIKFEVVSVLSKVKVRAETDVDAVEEQRRSKAPMQFQHAEAPPAETEPQQAAAAVAGADLGEPAEAHTPFVREGRKVGRNEPCPCGSGKKFKHCHGQLA